MRGLNRNVTGRPEYGLGTISNAPGALDDVIVICPVVRDNTANTNGR